MENADCISNRSRPTQTFWSHEVLGLLIERLRRDGYTIVGPRIDQEAIVYEEIENIHDLPVGWTDEQSPGSYRLIKTSRERYFEYAVGPHSWKKFLFPPNVPLMETQKTDQGWIMRDIPTPPCKFAFLGARACELAAIAIQDNVFLSKSYTDVTYQSRRRDNLIIAVNCTTAASTCFCTSMETGPRCTSQFDIVLTEIENGFLVESGTEVGSSIMGSFPGSILTEEQ
nr:hypothetical protein [Pirellula sp.]